MEETETKEKQRVLTRFESKVEEKVEMKIVIHISLEELN